MTRSKRNFFPDSAATTAVPIRVLGAEPQNQGSGDINPHACKEQNSQSQSNTKKHKSNSKNSSKPIHKGNTNHPVKCITSSHKHQPQESTTWNNSLHKTMQVRLTKMSRQQNRRVPWSGSQRSNSTKSKVMQKPSANQSPSFCGKHTLNEKWRHPVSRQWMQNESSQQSTAWAITSTKLPST